MSSNPLRKIKLYLIQSPFRMIINGFLLVILLGSLLLMLPISSRTGAVTPFLDALFTSTSAVCVTGLVIHNTATYWSTFGQFVIILLIQIGGLGVVTVTGAFAILSGRRIGLLQRTTMQEAIAAPQVGGIVRLFGFIIKTAALIEIIGTLLLFPAFYQDFGFLKGLSYAAFHSISAFCNAGFDLLGIDAPFSSLTAYATNPLVIVIISSLIVIGGIGFLTWDDIKTKKHHLHKYRMQTKVILATSTLLIGFGTLYFYFGEFAHKPFGERALLSIFQAITPRTAGFNTANLSALSETGQMVTIMLMIIGGSPGSTAGGIKTTTIAVLLSWAIAVFRRRENAHFFNRRIATQTVAYASTVLLMYLILFMAGALFISRLEHLPLLTCLFETASAIGTVGLSLGITPGLTPISHIILMGLMFFGRVGGLTLIFATISGLDNSHAKLPQERITVG